MRTSRQNCLAEIRKLASENNFRQADPGEKLHRASALETMRRILAAMSDKAFQVHLEGYDEDNATPIRFIKAITATCILLAATAAFPQSQLPSNIVDVFTNAPCECSSSDTINIDQYPTSFRSIFVRNAFDKTLGMIPFQSYSRKTNTGPLKLKEKGFTRNISKNIRVPEPGYYYIRFYDTENPALITVHATPARLIVKSVGKCTIHE